MLLEHFWWGSVFLLAVPVMAVLLVLGPRLLPEYRDPDAGTLDIASAALSLFAILSVIFGLKEIAQDGLGPLPVASLLAGIAVGVVFVRRQRALTDPMIDLQLFRIRAFSASLATNMLGIFIAIGYFLFVAQYLQLVLGLSPLQAGLWSLPSAAGFIVGSTAAPRILRRVRPAVVIGVGLAMGAIGLALLTGVDGSGDLQILVVASVVVSLGLAPVFTATTDLIVGSAPPERAGAASGISETGAELGGALGIAVLGSIGAAVYRSELADLLPQGVPAGAAAAARDTLGAAVGVAEGLPAQLSNALVDSARQAFIDGMRVSTAIAAIVSIAVAALAAYMLRDVPSGDGREEMPSEDSGEDAADPNDASTPPDPEEERSAVSA